MKPALLVTIDTETDNLWARTRELSFLNIQELPNLHHKLASSGVIPTYLVSYPVATTPIGRTALEKILEGQACEVGAHLHPWTTPPYGEGPDDGYKLHPMPSELQDGVFKAKMESLTEAIEITTGLRPVSYRAGRWGLAASHVSILERLGYGVDSSVTPGMAWSDRRDGKVKELVDYRRAPIEPYVLNYEDVCRPGTSRVLELPVSIVTCGWSDVLWERPGYFKQGSLLSKIAARMGLQQVWLRPSVATCDQMKEVASILFRHSVPVLNIMFHSSEVIPGGSPYNRTQDDVLDFYKRLEGVIGFMLGEGAQPMTMRDFAAQFSSASREVPNAR